VQPSAASACAVWLLSIAPLAVPGAEHWFSGLSRAGFCALPWIVYAGLPRFRSSRVDGARKMGVLAQAWSSIALALPPIALAARFDLGDGLDGGSVAALAIVSLLLGVALWSAAELCATEGARSSRYAAAWMVIVPGIPCLRAALERGGAPTFGDAPSWLVLAARASPMDWIVRASTEVGRFAAAGGSREITRPAWNVSLSALAPLCACVALLAIGRAGAPRERET
jgi:hypothetical protein